MKRAFWFRIESRGLLAMSRGMKPHDVGIYMILCALMHDRQEPLAYDPAWLARYCDTSKSAFEKAVDRLVCDGLFLLENGRLWSEHIQNELARCDEISEKARSSANARHKKTKENQSPVDADAMRSKRKTVDKDVDAQSHKGTVHSSNNRDDNAPCAAPDGASGASSRKLVSENDITDLFEEYAFEISAGVMDKIRAIHETRGFSADDLTALRSLAGARKLTIETIHKEFGGRHA